MKQEGFRMMNCPICGKKVPGGGFALCSVCREQISALRPEDRRYLWYARAVRRALFGAEAV